MYTKEQRLSISRKIATADLEKAQLDKAIEAVNEDVQKALVVDSANKILMDQYTPTINSYQLELAVLNGVVRSELLEEDLQNSAKRTIGNFFYPNNGVITPSIPNGYWISLPPFMLNKAIGKNYNEGYGVEANNEIALIPPIISAIDSFLATYTNEMERVTGQEAYTTPGPPPEDHIVVYTALRSALDSIKTLVSFAKTRFLDEKNIVQANPDSAPLRAPSLITAISDLNNIIDAISNWEALVDYNTAHGQTTVAGFYSYDPSLLYPTKAQASNLLSLKNSFTTRLAQASSRVVQVEGFLGTVTQNILNGEFLSFSGLYGDRAKTIDLRVNLVGGSLSQVAGSQKGIEAIDAQKNAIDMAVSVYTNTMVATLLESTTNGTDYVNLENSSGFSVGDRIYIASDTQEEISCIIQEIVGKRIKVNTLPPPKYRKSEIGRVYKVI